MKLFIHDDGSVTCQEHAPMSLKGFIEQEPKKRTYWTPRGTWEVATKSYLEFFKAQVGREMTCETCEPWISATA